MKRRKPKRKEQSKPADQALSQSDAEKPANPAAMEVEVESSANYVELQTEIEEITNPAEIQGETEKPTGAVVSSDIEAAAPGSAPPAGADRRSHRRYAFTAAVEVAAAEADSRLKTRLRDLSQQGCYVDTDTPIPLGTTAEIRITRGAESLEAQARVVYNQPGKGMGL